MKKFFVIMAVAALGFGASSCGKTYTCYCVDGNGTVSQPTVKATSTTDAALKCVNKSSGSTTCGLQ